MAQLKCIVCGKLITGNDKVCPACGAWIIGQKDDEPAPGTPKPKTPSLKVLIGPFIALALVIATVSYLSLTKNDEEPTQTEQTTIDGDSESQPTTSQSDEAAAEDEGGKTGPETSYPSVAGTYKGTIRTPTVIRLKQEGSQLSGTIRYTKFDSPALDINGSISPDGTFELTELGEDHQTPSGHITGTIRENTMTATFRNPKTGKATDFTLSR